MAPDGRNYSLDGLRGWAALMVCGFHMWIDMWRGVLPELSGSPAMIFFSGQFPIYLFFVLSGYVLTAGGWRSPKRTVVRQILKRYPRLFIPIAATVAVVFAVMILGLARHPEAFAALRNNWWDKGTIFEPSVPGAVSFAAVWAFTGTAMTQNYQPFLWTMSYELVGSILVLGFCLFERGGRAIYLFLGSTAALLMVFWPAMAPFAIGALLSLLKRDGLLIDIGRWSWPVVAVAVLAQYLIPDVRVVLVAATACLVAAVSSGGVSAALRSPVSKWLGRASFPIYLMQWPVIITVTSWLALAALPITLPVSVAIGAVGFVATLLAAWLFLPVERLTFAVCRVVGRLVPEPRPAYVPADA